MHTGPKADDFKIAKCRKFHDGLIYLSLRFEIKKLTKYEISKTWNKIFNGIITTIVILEPCEDPESFEQPKLTQSTIRLPFSTRIMATTTKPFQRSTATQPGWTPLPRIKRGGVNELTTLYYGSNFYVELVPNPTVGYSLMFLVEIWAPWVNILKRKEETKINWKIDQQFPNHHRPNKTTSEKYAPEWNNRRGTRLFRCGSSLDEHHSAGSELQRHHVRCQSEP